MLTILAECFIRRSLVRPPSQVGGMGVLHKACQALPGAPPELLGWLTQVLLGQEPPLLAPVGAFIQTVPLAQFASKLSLLVSRSGVFTPFLSAA